MNSSKLSLTLLFASIFSLISFIANDARAQWVQTNAVIGEPITALGVSGLNLFAGTESSGIFFSSDNGESWITGSSGLPTYVNHDTFSTYTTYPDVFTFTAIGDNVFAGTSSGVFLWNTSTTSWEADGLSTESVNALAAIGTNLFAGTPDGVFLLSGNNTSWTEARSGLPVNTYTYTDTDGTYTVTTYTAVYAFAVEDSNLFAGTDNGVYCSTNNGLNGWVAAGLQNNYINILAANGTDIVAGDYGVGAFFSSDFAASWASANDGLPATVYNDTGGKHTEYYVNAFGMNGSNLYAGTDAGVFLWNDNSSSWMADGLTNEYVTAFSVSGENVFAGTYDASVWVDSGCWLYDRTSSLITPAQMPYVNQFDSGAAYGYPQRYCIQGGNLCGPCALKMALSALGNNQFGVIDIYNNSMTKPIYTPGCQSTTTEASEGFNPSKAAGWLSLQNMPVPMPLSIDDNKTIGWAQIDAYLDAGRPVLLGTDLTWYGYDIRSSGHYLVLLGRGKDQRIIDSVKERYSIYAADYGVSISGYYVVADPAGDYWANPEAGGSSPGNPAMKNGDLGHYGLSAILRQQPLNIGGLPCPFTIDSGGWFAVYPTELVQQRITLNGGGKVLRGLVFGLPTSSSLPQSKLILATHSPVTILVTNPMGLRTGLVNDSTVEEIPTSSFVLDIAEEEEGDVDTITNGDNYVYVDNPQAGTYTVLLTGTDSANNSAYHLDMTELGAGDKILLSQKDSSTISAGEQRTYTITLGGSGVGPVANSIEREIQITTIYPNPSNGRFTLNYVMMNDALARIDIISENGALVSSVFNGVVTAGNHSLDWNASSLPPGAYYCRISANGSVESKLLNIVR